MNWEINTCTVVVHHSRLSRPCEEQEQERKTKQKRHQLTHCGGLRYLKMSIVAFHQQSLKYSLHRPFLLKVHSDVNV